MLDLLIDNLSNPRTLAMVFAAVAAIATVLTLAMPLIATDALSNRMRSVAIEREKLRQRERERLARGEKVTLRQSPKLYIQRIVEQFNLNKWVGQDEARALLVQAGYRGQAPYVTYLFFRMVMPTAMLLLSLFYVFVILKLDQPATVKVGLCIGATQCVAFVHASAGRGDRRPHRAARWAPIDQCVVEQKGERDDLESAFSSVHRCCGARLGWVWW